MNPAQPASRRRLLGISIAAGATVTLTGCGRHRHRLKLSDRALDSDVRLLNDLLTLERRAVAAYTAGIPLLEGHARRAAMVFLRQELAHTGMLLSLIKRAGGPAVPRAASYQLGNPRTGRDVLTLLHHAERAQLAGYTDAVGRLSPGYLRASVAAILADDAQHVSVLRSLLGLNPIPSPFVTGGE